MHYCVAQPAIKHDNAVNRVAGMREGTMRRWKTATLALLAAVLVGGSAAAMIASAPAGSARNSETGSGRGRTHPGRCVWQCGEGDGQ